MARQGMRTLSKWSLLTIHECEYRAPLGCTQASSRIDRCDLPQTGESQKMATQLCHKCKQAHPGRVCDYDDKAECTETKAVDEVTQTPDEPSKKEED
jgi:hypothetical protein